MPQLEISSSQSQNCLALAIFDNIPDSQDELAFRKNDVLEVIEQNIPNIGGWWLCSLRGKQGLCPANRLRLQSNVYDTPNREFNSFTFSQRNDCRTPQQVRRYDENGYYNMPNRFSPSTNEGNDYDVPPSRHVVLSVPKIPNSASPSCSSPIGRDADAYDTPRPHNHLNSLIPLTPSSSASSLTADSMSSSNRSSMANMPDYDVPKPFSKGPQLMLQPTQLYDVPPSHNLKELPLELDSALENLERLENETMSSIKKLLGFVGPGWRCKEKLDDTILDIKLAVTRLQTSLNDLAEFGEGTLGNASKAADKNLSIKLTPLVNNLRKSYQTVNESSQKLSESNWKVDCLCVTEDSEDKYIPDSLDSLISCTKALTEDVREITSFIRGNSLLLFKKEKEKEWTNEYDYLNEKPAENYELIINKRSESDSDLNFDTNDRNLLIFFGAQFITHYKNLLSSIDAFLKTVERNQPPKIFLAHGKFVVLSAHKLVHIGDTVHRNMTCKVVKERALNCSNSLSDVLAQSVIKIKQAALQFPTVTAVQEMVDSVLDISHMANNLKMCLLQAAANFL